jgi:hypothetical protein
MVGKYDRKFPKIPNKNSTELSVQIFPPHSIPIKLTTKKRRTFFHLIFPVVENEKEKNKKIVIFINKKRKTFLQFFFSCHFVGIFVSFNFFSSVLFVFGCGVDLWRWQVGGGVDWTLQGSLYNDLVERRGLKNC